MPCYCGVKYYPDKALAARPLEPHEYVSGHPGYRPLQQEATNIADETISTISSEHADATAYPKEESNPACYSVGNQIRTSHARNPSTESDDPLTHSEPMAKLPTVSRTQRKAKHVRYHSQSSEDPLAMDEPQSLSGITDMLTAVDLGADVAAGSSANPSVEAREGTEDAAPVYVETKVKHGAIRCKDSQGHKFESQPHEWQEIFTDEGSYFLLTQESGLQFWTWEFGSSLQDQASGSKASGKKREGKHRLEKGKHRKAK